MAVLQRDRFVAAAFEARDVEVAFDIAPIAETLTPDQPASEDGDVVQSLAPDETVVPVIVAIVLVRLPGTLGLSRIVAAVGQPFGWNRGCENRGTGIEMQRHATLQANGVTGVSPRRKVDDTAAAGGHPVDSPVEGITVDRLAVADGAHLAHVQPFPWDATRRSPCSTLVKECGKGEGRCRGALQELSS